MLNAWFLRRDQTSTSKLEVLSMNLEGKNFLPSKGETTLNCGQNRHLHIKRTLGKCLVGILSSM